MKKNSNKRILTISLIAIIGVGLLASMNPGTANGVASFNIISENAEENDIKIPNAVCFSKTSTSLATTTSGGTITGVIDSDSSPFLADNPQFTFTGADLQSSGTTINSIGHFLKMRCEVGFDTASDPTSPTGLNQLACEDPERSAECQVTNSKYIEVRPSAIQVEIYATNEQGVKERVYLGNHQTGTERLQNGQEENLMFIQIPTTQILQYMDKGNYDSLLEIRTSGILNMVMEDFSIDGQTLSLIKYYIGANDIPTFFNIAITEDLAEVGTETDEVPQIGGEELENPCPEPSILDKQTNECITPETEEQGEQKKQDLGENTQDLGDPNASPPKENKTIFDILADLWLWFIGLFSK